VQETKRDASKQVSNRTATRYTSSIVTRRPTIAAALCRLERDC
jgi:hypothetical protein